MIIQSKTWLRIACVQTLQHNMILLWSTEHRYVEQQKQEVKQILNIKINHLILAKTCTGYSRTMNPCYINICYLIMYYCMQSKASLHILYHSFLAMVWLKSVHILLRWQQHRYVKLKPHAAGTI